MQDTRRLNEGQARMLLREWQEDLRLLDWNIQVHVKLQAQMHGQQGLVTVNERKQCAWIRLLDPTEPGESELETYCMETALVHELLHCSLAPFLDKRYKCRTVAQEQTVHKTSGLLVRMKREMRMLAAQAKRKRVA